MLLNFAKQLKERGFRVWIPRSQPDNPSEIVAAIDDHLGVVYESLGVGYTYATMHVPCQGVGHGYWFSEGGLSIDTMEKCCRCFVPRWALSGKIRKWSLEDWAAKHADRYVEI